jgi:hypothetical protein
MQFYSCYGFNYLQINTLTFSAVPNIWLDFDFVLVKFINNSEWRCDQWYLFRSYQSDTICKFSINNITWFGSLKEL